MKKFIYFLIVLTYSCSNSEDSTIKIKGSAPIISSIFIDVNGKFAGDEISITATVDDPDNDIISYDWTVSGGKFSKVSNTNIKWLSPGNTGSYIIKLVITDSNNNVTSRTESIDLNLGPETFQKFVDASYSRGYSESEIVNIGSYIYFYSSESIGQSGTSYRLKKINQNGIELWTKVFGNFPNSNKRLIGMRKTPDGNLILGVSGAIIKVNTEGDILWTFNNQNLRNFVEMDNGNYFFIGAIFENEWKPAYHILTPEGVLVDEGIIKTNYSIYGLFDVVTGPNPNTFFVLARVSNPQNPDNISEILHINSTGVILNAFGFPYNPRTKGRLFRDFDGSYSAFYTTSYGFDKRINRINFTSNGVLLSDITYSFAQINSALDVEPLSQGGYLIAGTFGSNTSLSKSFILRTNQAGDIEWKVEYGTNSDLMDFTSSVLELEDGKIMASGSIYRPEISTNPVQVYLHKYHANGSL